MVLGLENLTGSQKVYLNAINRRALKLVNYPEEDESEEYKNEYVRIMSEINRCVDESRRNLLPNFSFILKIREVKSLVLKDFLRREYKDGHLFHSRDTPKLYELVGE